MSGSIGGHRILRNQVEPTMNEYIRKVLGEYPGFQSCAITGSYNAGTKKDHGDIDLVVYIEAKDLKSLKKDFKSYLESLPDDITIPFATGKRKGDKAQLFGSIVTCGFPIAGTTDPVQIDNILVTTKQDAHFQKSFLNLNAQKQALFQGLVRVLLQHEDPNQIFKHFDLDLPEPGPNQEYEFVLSTAGLSLRLVTLTSDFKEVDRVEVWRSNNWSDVEWLLKDYDMNSEYESILDIVSKKIKDDRSRRRIVGIMKSMIRVGPGEVGTPKGDAKEAGINLAKEKLGVNEGLRSYLKEALIKRDKKYIYKEKQSVQPKTKEELRTIIKETVNEEGPDCDLNFIDTSLIDDMSVLFYRSKFDGDISKWNVANVKNMSYMFQRSDFDGDISGWDVRNVEDMNGMFAESNFDGDISKWNVKNVKDMSYMFAYSKFDGDISGWNVSNVRKIQGMFTYSDFNGDISKWNVRNVRDWEDAFVNCPLENQPDKQPKFNN